MTEPIKTLLLTNLTGTLLTAITQGAILIYFGVKFAKCAGKPCKKFLDRKKKQKQFKQSKMNAIEMTEDSQLPQEEAYE